METLDNIGIKLFVFAALKEHQLCSASVNALQIVFSNSVYESSAKWETCQIFKEDRQVVRVQLEHLKQNGYFIRCIQSSSFQGYDSIHESWEDIISLEEQWLKAVTK